MKSFGFAAIVLVLGLAVMGCTNAGKAGKLSKPVAELTKEDVKASLEKGGWRVGQANEASSGANKNFNVSFDGEGKKGVVEFMSSPNDASRRATAKIWEEKKAAVLSVDKAVLSIDMNGDTAAAQKVLDGMMGK